MFVKLNKALINKALIKAGVTQQIKAQEVIKDFKIYIQQNFGDNTLKYIKQVYIKNYSLVIKIDNSLINTSLKNKEQEIISFLNKKEKVIKRIRFKV